MPKLSTIISLDEQAALESANQPSATNPYATMGDLSAAGLKPAGSPITASQSVPPGYLYEVDPSASSLALTITAPDPSGPKMFGVKLVGTSDVNTLTLNLDGLMHEMPLSEVIGSSPVVLQVSGSYLEYFLGADSIWRISAFRWGRGAENSIPRPDVAGALYTEFGASYVRTEISQPPLEGQVLVAQTDTSAVWSGAGYLLSDTGEALINVYDAPAPTVGQVLTADGAGAATWQPTRGALAINSTPITADQTVTPGQLYLVDASAADFTLTISAGAADDQIGFKLVGEGTTFLNTSGTDGIEQIDSSDDIEGGTDIRYQGTIAIFQFDALAQVWRLTNYQRGTGTGEGGFPRDLAGAIGDPGAGYTFVSGQAGPGAVLAGNSSSAAEWLPVGSPGQVLTVNTGGLTGIGWAAPPAAVVSVVKLFAWALEAATLDVSTANAFVPTNPPTGNSVLTLVGGVDGCSGLIYFKQNAGSTFGLTFITAGRTQLRDLNVPNTDPLAMVNSVTMYQYCYVTIAGTAYIVINKVYLQ